MKPCSSRHLPDNHTQGDHLIEQRDPDKKCRLLHRLPVLPCTISGASGSTRFDNENEHGVDTASISPQSASGESDAASRDFDVSFHQACRLD